MNDNEILDLPPFRDIDEAEFARRKAHLVREARQDVGRDRFRHRRPEVLRARGRLSPVVLGAIVVLLLALAVPAVGVIKQVVSMYWMPNDITAAVPTASDVTIASNDEGLPWRFVATTSDRGLCFGIFNALPTGGATGSSWCGPTDVEGDPYAADVPLHQVSWPGLYGVCGLGSEELVVFGTASSQVASVDVQMKDGQIFSTKLAERPLGAEVPLDAYWAPLPDSVRSSKCQHTVGIVDRVIARDAKGEVLERRRWISKERVAREVAKMDEDLAG